MIRTTKALARLGILAVTAGAALSAPFAAGVANAATITFTVTGPAVCAPACVNGSATTAAVASAKNDDAARHISVTPLAGFDATTQKIFSLLGSSAYFANPIPPGYTQSNNNQTLTCAAPCAAPPAVFVDDNVAESASVAMSDGSGNLGSTTLKFNGIDFKVSAQECPSTDIDTVVNCVTQGQTGTPIPLTVHYAAGQSGTTDADGAFRQLVVTVTNPTLVAPAGPRIVGAAPATPNTITCTTDASGNCNLQIVDTNAKDIDPVAPPATNGADIITAAIDQVETPNYPGIGTIAGGFAFGVALPPPSLNLGPQAKLNISSGSVTNTRMDLISAKLIAPDAQDATSTGAEPGDAVQLIYQVTGSCSPVAPNVTCTGAVALAGLSVPLTVDHGFFTPNCEQAQSDSPVNLALNFYGQCSFTTAPAAGGQVGSLTNSGTTKSVVTDTAGQFVVTIGMGRDSAFDNFGVVQSAVTSGSIASTIPGDTRLTGATASCTSASGDNAVVPLTTGIVGLVAGAGGPPPAGGNPGDYGDCPATIQWTTQEQPLNGGTAKIAVIPALALPNNVSIDTENNYNASDSGTINVPDLARVVFQVKVTDQFGNLVSYIAGSSPVKFTKTGPGGIASCAGSTTIDACVIPGPVVAAGSPATFTAQADGTSTQTGKLAGTFLNLPTGLDPADTLAPQVRYSADVNSQTGTSFNDGYSTGVPGAIDGTQTTVVSWEAPTTTFGTLTAGLWSYNAGKATAATDTLTLNFYNQLAQPVVTFTVTPANKVPTSTAVTVTAKEVDQFGNPIVGTCPGGAALLPGGLCGGTSSGTIGGVGVITAIRSGQNEASCVPTQNTVNGAAAAVLTTNTSGIAGYTFSCNQPGVSTVTMVVTGPGGTQLASGKEAITFTGAGVTRTVERPSVNLTSFHKHHITVHVSTDPALGAGHTVNVYRLKNGIKHLVGQTHTGPKGNASLTFHGLRSGATWRVAAKVVDLGTQYRSEYSVAVSHRVK